MYTCTQCDIGLMDEHEARMHNRIEGHMVEEEPDDDLEDED